MQGQNKIMSNRLTPRVSSRKVPKQARSTELVATILEAASRVLEKEGAARFTTARVAERAGVSIGSLYQYFPNKAAILFRLQTDEWQQTATMLSGILKNPQKSPPERLRQLVDVFIQSECDEALMRTALNDAAPLYRDAPEGREARAAGDKVFEKFMLEALPVCTPEKRQLAGRLISTTLGAAGKNFSETPRSADEIRAYAQAMADMFCAYLSQIEHD